MALKIEDVGTRLNRVMLECLAIRQQLDRERGLGADTGNLAERAAAALPADGSAITLRPYGLIAPGLCVGFEEGKGAIITARRAVAAQGAAQGTEIAEIAVEEIGGSAWLTLEYLWNWEAVVAKRSAHVLMEIGFQPGTLVRPRLRIRTRDGAQHDYEAGAFHIGAIGELLISSMVLPEATDLDYDFAERPRVILFFETLPGLFTLNKLFFW